MSRNRTVKILMFGVFSLVLGAAAGAVVWIVVEPCESRHHVAVGSAAESCRSDCGAGKTRIRHLQPVHMHRGRRDHRFVAEKKRDTAG